MSSNLYRMVYIVFAETIDREAPYADTYIVGVYAKRKRAVGVAKELRESRGEIRNYWVEGYGVL